MEKQNKEYIVRESPFAGKLLHDGHLVSPPLDWIFVPGGDAALTRRVKAGGSFWVMVHTRRNRIESLGLWAPKALVEMLKLKLDAERADPAYQKKLDSARRSRDRKQEQYEVEFYNAVLDFLGFHERYGAVAELLAAAVTRHAVPVGSGTVARTRMLALAQRAEAAVIAWMRHQTTLYDDMHIVRVAGRRREVRRSLAGESRILLKAYRDGAWVDSEHCPLQSALKLKSPEKI